jgi:hypothetical protein
MATNDERGLQWLAGSLAWERSLTRLRDAATAAEIGVTQVVISAATAEPACAPRRDRRSAIDAGRPAASNLRRSAEDRGADRRPRRVHVDDGVPSSA